MIYSTSATVNAVQCEQCFHCTNKNRRLIFDFGENLPHRLRRSHIFNTGAGADQMPPGAYQRYARSRAGSSAESGTARAPAPEEELQAQPPGPAVRIRLASGGHASEIHSLDSISAEGAPSERMAENLGWMGHGKQSSWDEDQ